jgi:hemin uptake protein HemP
VHQQTIVDDRVDAAAHPETIANHLQDAIVRPQPIVDHPVEALLQGQVTVDHSGADGFDFDGFTDPCGFFGDTGDEWSPWTDEEAFT